MRRPNRTNISHGLVGVAITLVTGLALLPVALIAGFSPVYGLWAGAYGASLGFAFREHAHEQHDIKVRTGVAIEDQNPIDGFRWKSQDRIDDFRYPLVWSHATAIVFTAGFFLI